MYFFSTLFIISHLHIDMCYSSIIANSTLVDVVPENGGERLEDVRAFPLLTTDLTPNYVHFLNSYYYQPVSY